MGSAQMGRRSHRSGESGQIILEFLILMLVLLTVIFTFIEVCLLSIEKHEFNRVARYAARVWAVKTRPAGGEWSLQQMLRESAEIRRDDAGGGIFCQMQAQIGTGYEVSNREGLDGVQRDGVEFRTYLPVLMPFTDLFIGYKASPAEAPLTNPGGGEPGITGSEVGIIQALGVRRVIRAKLFVPVVREPIEKPVISDTKHHDNDYDDNYD